MPPNLSAPLFRAGRHGVRKMINDWMMSGRISTREDSVICRLTRVRPPSETWMEYPKARPEGPRHRSVERRRTTSLSESRSVRI